MMIITKCMGRQKWGKFCNYQPSLNVWECKSGVNFAMAEGERKLCRTARDLSGRGEKFVG